MRKLLSLTPSLVESFHDITGYSPEEWFVAHDPVDQQLASGGATAWLLRQAYAKLQPAASFESWLASEKRVIIHAGGHARRLPSYAPSGKVLTPIPLFHGERGQQLTQHLLSLQVPLLEQIMLSAPQSLRTLIASGDVLIRATEPLPAIPEADVVCFGLPLAPQIATHHGVFVMEQATPTCLLSMLQKPSIERLNSLACSHTYLTDIGIWLLSDRALRLLIKKSMNQKQQPYDLYSDFGLALGDNPTTKDDELAELSVAILPLPGGQFYHFGTSRALLSSMNLLQTTATGRFVDDLSKEIQSNIYIQNAFVKPELTVENHDIWIENSYISSHWHLTHDNIITGVPKNQWRIDLAPGQCVDIVPVGTSQWAIRTYRIDDTFQGETQAAPLYPLVSSIKEIGPCLKHMLYGKKCQQGREIYQNAQRISADRLLVVANHVRMSEQRNAFQHYSLERLATSSNSNVFYQADLQHAARGFTANPNTKFPIPIPQQPIHEMCHAMFCAELAKCVSRPVAASRYRQEAYNRLRQEVLQHAAPVSPHLAMPQGQSVTAHAPARIDIAGGWTDTPPHCFMEGADVVNIAITLDGKMPIHATITPIPQYHIQLLSIDHNSSQVITTYGQLRQFKQVGSPFSIHKAALALAGFLPEYSQEPQLKLQQQLRSLGAGLQVATHTPIPAGSGLGTSSILAAAVLSALSRLLGLEWDCHQIAQRTLMLEQLITTGGGWQDQYGALLPAVKYLHSNPGIKQLPAVAQLPDTIYTDPDYRPLHLLYYTGITRTAKNVLQQISDGMFLNQNQNTQILRQIHQNAIQTQHAIRQADIQALGHHLNISAQLNQQLNAQSIPQQIQQLIDRISDYTYGTKLPGAGAGGFLYIIAKDQQAATRIRQILQDHPSHPQAAFADMQLSQAPIQVSIAPDSSPGS